MHNGCMEGRRFGKWLVLAGKQRRNRSWYHLCRCDCGLEKWVQGVKLRRGESRGCRACGSSAHGETRDGKRSPEYGIWASMCRRCEPGNVAAPNYYDRGIRVCEEWRGRGGFQRFIESVGRRPSVEYSIDRIDNERGYEPGNVRWATRIEQQNNTRKSVYLTIDGVTKTVPRWSVESGIPIHVIHGRLARGNDPKNAVFRALAEKPIPITVGSRFGSWTVTGEATRRGSRDHYPCQCVCGRKKLVRDSHLRQGTSTKCSRWCRGI
jgi:hypothetical protein